MQRKKPDLLWILVVAFCLGVVTTGYAQSRWAPAETPLSSAAAPR